MFGHYCARFGAFFSSMGFLKYLDTKILDYGGSVLALTLILTLNMDYFIFDPVLVFGGPFFGF